jgi:nucleotide-binding universal stress UspA family protein
MSFKDIFAVATSEKESAHVLDFSLQLAEQQGGKVSTWVVGWQPSLPMVTEIWVADPFWGDMLTEVRQRLDQETAAIKTYCDRAVGPVPTDAILLEYGAAKPVIGMRARHSDVTIVGRPSGISADADQTILEAALFSSGRPVIIVPPGWKKSVIGRSVLVGWKPTREAARALGDAAHLLAAAENVSVVTVDARPSEDAYGPRPGLDISAHLARRGCKTQLTNIDSMGRTEATAIFDQAKAVNADLIVMGGFGHSRLSEIVFGGVTRELLQKTSIPILMSH